MHSIDWDSGGIEVERKERDVAFGKHIKTVVNVIHPEKRKTRKQIRDTEIERENAAKKTRENCLKSEAKQ
jgi:hypothetical protein